MNRQERCSQSARATPSRARISSAHLRAWFCATLCALPALAVTATACKRDPTRVEAENEAADRAQLTTAVMRDVQLVGLMRKADAFAQAGDDDKAVAMVKDEAIPAADRAVTAADAMHAASAWGAPRVQEVDELAHARRDALPAYLRALQGEDLDAKLNATLAQVKLEQQAMTVLAHVNGENVPPAASASLTASSPDAHL